MTTKMPSTINDQVYRASVMTPLSEIARTLEQVLSRRLTAVIVGLKDGKTIAHWASAIPRRSVVRTPSSGSA